MTQRILFGITGMHCGSCASALEARLLATEHVQSAAVNHTLGLAKIEFDAASQLNETVLEQVVREQGLKVYKTSPVAWHSELLQQQKQLEIRLASAVFLGMWIMLLSIPFYFAVAMEASTQNALLGSLALLTLALLFTASRTIWLMAWRNLRVGVYGSDLLITIGHIAALALSVINISTGHPEIYFDALAMLCLAQTVTRYLEIMQARANAGSLLEQADIDIAMVMAPRAPAGWLAVKTIRPGDEFQLAQGDILPVDACLTERSARFDLSVVTGESEAQNLAVDAKLPAGAMLLDTVANVRASTAYGEAARDIQRLQAMTEMCEKPQLQNRLDTWAKRWMQALLIALGLQLILLLMGDHSTQDSLRQLVTVLLLGCPCALSLAGVVPLYRRALSWRKAGIKVRSLVSIESCATVDTIVFDKTGTLTSAQLSPHSRQVLAAWSSEDLGLLKVAARLSCHPASESLRTFLVDKPLPEPAIAQCIEHPGKGIELKLVGGEVLRLGSFAWLNAVGVLLSEKPAGTMALAIDTRLIGGLHFTQSKQENLCTALSALKHQGLQLILCSGDSAQAVQQFTAGSGSLFSAVYAQYRPEQKRALIQNLKQQGHKVAMVGDGINDVASSSVADLGIGFLNTAGTGLHQDLQLRSAAQVSQLAELLQQAKLTLQVSRMSVLIPIITTSTLLLLNMFITVPPLLVALSMFGNIALICLLAGVSGSSKHRDDVPTRQQELIRANF